MRLASLLAACALCTLAQAQDFPSRAVRIAKWRKVAREGNIVVD